MSTLLLTSHASTKRHELMTNDCQCGDFKDWNKTDFWRVNRIVSFEVAAIQRVAAAAAAVAVCQVKGEIIAFAYDINLQQDDYNNDKHLVQLCVYRIVQGNYGSVLVNVIASIIDEGSILALHWTGRRKLRQQWSLSTRRRRLRETHLQKGMWSDRCTRSDRWNASRCCAYPACLSRNETATYLWSVRCTR